VLVALAAVLLAGCSTVPVPRSATPDELDRIVRAELDRQWAFTGLEGVIPRPDYPVEELGSVDGFSQGFGACMQEVGFTSWGVGDTGLDMSSVNSGGARSTPEQQYDYYECIARFPNIDPLTDEQLDFVYDYYQRWLVPCLETEGYELHDVPTREEFHEYRAVNGWLWGPYSAMVAYPQGAELHAVLGKCKPTLAGMDGWSRDVSIFG
jgi:hypothetical protein